MSRVADDDAMRRWLEQRIATDDEPRRLMLCRRRRYTASTIERALIEARRRFARRGIVSIAWATLERGGVNDGHAGVVVLVRRKIPKAQLPRSKRLPKQFTIRVHGRSTKVPVDVQVLPRGDKQAAIRPGDLALVVNAQTTATLSAVFDGPKGMAALISGHVGNKGDVFRARLGSGVTIALGEVTVSRNDATIDAARIDAVNPEHASLMSLMPTTIRDLGHGDHSVVLTFHLAQGAGDAKAWVDGVDLSAEFNDFDGKPVTMTGLIKMGRSITVRGDSGAPVLDYLGRLVGFVIGSAGGHTYVIPARKVFDAMG